MRVFYSRLKRWKAERKGLPPEIKITSSLDLREVLRAIEANIREVMRVDAVSVSLPDPASGKSRLYAMDFPNGKGVLKEGLLITPGGAGKKAMDTLNPPYSSTIAAVKSSMRAETASCSWRK